MKNLRDERNYLEIDLKKVQENIINIKRFIGDTDLMSIIKGNAYGLGLEPMARVTEEFSDWFGVSTPEEALSLRAIGVKIPILVLGYVSDKYIPKMIENNVTLTGFSYDYINHLNQIVDNKKLDIHIKIDTGLSRLGLYNPTYNVDNYIKEIQKILSMNNINVTGIYTHFAVAGSEHHSDKKFTEEQYALFESILRKAEILNLDLGYKHICNSDAIFEHQDKYMDMVRIGKFIFGYGQEVQKNILQVKTPFKLYGRIVRIIDMPKDQSIGYGRTYVTKEKTKLATVTFGFTDGFRRNMSGKAQAIVNGKKTDIVGRIAADYLQVNVTGIQNVQIGDYVLLMGREGQQTLYPSEIGKIINGSTPELNTQIHSRVPRIYING